MRKLSAAIAAISLFALMVPTSFAAFADVSDSHDNKDAINYMESNKIVQGYPDGSFQPDRKINRAEFTKIIMGAYFTSKDISGCDTATLKFPDVAKNVWYSPYICLAVKEGVIAGYPDGTFKPEQDIAFVEAAKIVLEASTTKEYKDAIWYKPYVEALESAKAIPTTIGEFEHKVTRGEMSEITYRLKESITTKTSLDYATLEKQSTVNPNTFDPTKVETGDKLGAMSVDSITKSKDSITVAFQGEINVTGEYKHYTSTDKEPYKDNVCFKVVDKTSLEQLPSYSQGTNDEFCFSNDADAEKELGKEGSEGSATITINNYTVSAPLTQGTQVNTAKLVKVLVKQETKAASSSSSSNGGAVIIPDPNAPVLAKLLIDPSQENVIDLEKHKAGDKVGAWTIDEITPFKQGTDISPTNVIIKLSGVELEIQGTYEKITSNSSFLADMICMTNFSAETLKTMPIIKDKVIDEIKVCFSNIDLAKKEFETAPSKGTAKVAIKNFVISMAAGEVTDTAELIKVLSTEALLQVIDPNAPLQLADPQNNVIQP